MGAVKHVSDVFSIPTPYLKQTSVENRVHGVVNKVWLKTLICSRQIPEFFSYEALEDDEVQAWLHQGEDFGSEWQHVYFQVLPKKEKQVIPLPRMKTSATDQSNEPPVSFAEGLQYVFQTNHRNLWKEMYKRFSHDPYSGKSSSTDYHINLVPCETVMREIIARMYGCPVIATDNEGLDGSEQNLRGKRPLRDMEPHCNILPALVALEMPQTFIIIFQSFIPHTLQDCVTYSPAVLGSCHTKPLFLVYQLLQAMCCLHDRGLLMGEITLCDALLSDSLWIQIVPRLEDNIHDFPPETPKQQLTSCSKHSTGSNLVMTGDVSAQMISHEYGPLAGDVTAHKTTEGCNAGQSVELEQACEAWVAGRMSNLEYLTRLNQLAGRRHGDPTCHHVLPWVTDFSSPNGPNWRDLTKSKFRLNKGDRQLDLTFDVAGTGLQVPHHVSDVLSDITYYVYLSRRTPKSILCKVVRSVWVPAEYPSSIQRLQEWTPDECIPEFFTDPSVFKSFHEDLPDLEIPPWSSSPEDFIEKHREMLESCYVSERLNHWIDLTFGYKLSGTAAVKSKNVCLHLADSHTTLSTSGVVQLFTQPHPARITPSPYWGKFPPRLVSQIRKSGEVRFNSERENDENINTFEEEENTQPKSSPLALSRLLSRSRGSLLTPTTEESPVLGQTCRTGSVAGAQISNNPNTSTISLPRDFNPVAMLQACESLRTFLDKTLHQGVSNKSLKEQCSEPNNPVHTPDCEYSLNYGRKQEGSRYKLQVVAAKRSKEMQILGCLLVELFLASKLRPFKRTCSSNTLFENRLHHCVCVFNQWSDQIPRCVRHVVPLLLQVQLSNTPNALDDNDQQHNLIKSLYPVITSDGLPPPSAHQLLQPLFTSVLFPFPPQFPRLYALIKKSREYASLNRELSWHARGSASQDTDINLLSEKLGECWVKSLAADIVDVIGQLDGPQVQLLLPHVRHLLEERNTCVQAAWYLFDPMSQALGPRETCTHLLDSIVKLYSDPGVDIEDVAANCHDLSIDATSGASREAHSREAHSSKRAKLYHRSFLLRLIVRLGLRTFLDNFVAPLVEAVGGYHEMNQQESAYKNDAGNSRRRKYSSPSSHLQSCELGEPIEGGCEETPNLDVASALSPLDEDSSGELERRSTDQRSTDQRSTYQPAEEEEATDGELEQEVFVLEGDEDSAPLDRLMDQLDLREDDTDDVYQDTGSTGSTGSTGTTGNTSGNLKSPTIAIPGSTTAIPGVDYEVFDDKDAVVAATDDSDRTDGFSFASIVRTDEDVSGEIQNTGMKRNNGKCKVSDMSAESLIWLAHRLGPVLTARCLSRNLLRMLTLCYLRVDNLRPMSSSNLHTSSLAADPNALEGLRIADGCVVGDKNAANVLNCLSSIVSLYGEQLVVLQYLPHMGELIALCRRKLTPNLEAGLIGCLALLRHIVPYMTDNTLMDQLQDVILKSILHPAVRLLSTTRLTYPSGEIARKAVAAKFCDALYLLALRLGKEMTHRHLAVPALQRFFLTFTKAHAESVFSAHGANPFTELAESEVKGIDCPVSPKETVSPLRSFEDSSYLEIRRDGTVTEWAVKRGPSVQIMRTKSHVRDNDPVESYSPPKVPRTETTEADVDADPIRTQATVELKAVFSPKLAHLVYIPFFRFLGEAVLEQSLKNHQLIRDLCFEYEQEMQTAAPAGIPLDILYLSDYLSLPLDMERAGSGSFGTNVALIGNRIELQQQDLHSHSGSGALSDQRDVLSLMTGRMEANTSRHLRGNWLAYWEHEIGRSEKDVRFNFKQIKLQTFAGHTNSVRCIVALGNENSFLSGSRDKTVKLWSLRSQGDGSAVSNCQWSYTGHRKSILNVAFIESLRLVASCDSTVQLWDPWLGRVVSGPIGDTSTPGRSVPPVGVLKALPAPSPLLVAATTDASLRVLDARTFSFVNQLKVSLSPAGLIRCLAIGPNGHWVAVGQSSGFLTILDIRTGLVTAAWKGHEGEVLQLVALNDSTLVSSSLDQTVSVWSTVDGKLKFHMKGPTEPVHCMAAYGMELISGTTANRIGVHTAIDSTASFSSTRLRSDTFRGVLTTMAVLPLNRLLVLGSDNGVISLLC